jgi:hypothetical protein
MAGTEMKESFVCLGVDGCVGSGGGSMEKLIY